MAAPSSPPRGDTERDEPPLVAGLIINGVAQAERAIRTLIRSINRRVLLFLWPAGAVGIFVGILALSIAQSPDWVGVGRGLAVGLFTALLFAAGFGWLLLWALQQERDAPPEQGAAVSTLNDVLAPTLRELNAVRADVIRQVKSRSVLRVPVALLGGIAVWTWAQWGDDPPGLIEFVIFAVAGALAGELWAAAKLDREYQRLYKARVLPQLAARLGDLTYKPASTAPIEQLAAHGILPAFDNSEAEDAIVGTHRTLPIEIVEAKLTFRSKSETRVAFDGVLVDIVLPRRLSGTTVILTDKGSWENLKRRWKSGDLEPVRLEDPAFEQSYEVYSSDQVEARALLTPAFMERFTQLSKKGGYALPGALAMDNRLVLALPKQIGTGDLFDPPPYWKPAGGRALLRLEEDIRAVLRMADAVIELDFWATGRKNSGSQA